MLKLQLFKLNRPFTPLSIPKTRARLTSSELPLVLPFFSPPTLKSAHNYSSREFLDSYLNTESTLGLLTRTNLAKSLLLSLKSFWLLSTKPKFLVCPMARSTLWIRKSSQNWVKPSLQLMMLLLLLPLDGVPKHLTTIIVKLHLE